MQPSQQPSPVTFDTFVIERAFPVPLARVYAAFTDPRLKERWFAQGGNHDVERFFMQFEVGGVEQTRYRFRPGTPFPGVLLEAESVYLDIVPEQRIVTASSMAIGGRRISAALETYEFSASGATGARMLFTHQAAFFEGADGPAMRRAGWEQLLGRLSESLTAEG